MARRGAQDQGLLRRVWEPHAERTRAGNREARAAAEEIREPEARSQKPEARSQKPEAGSRKPEARSQKPEARSQELRSQKPEAGSQELRSPELRSQNGIPYSGFWLLSSGFCLLTSPNTAHIFDFALKSRRRPWHDGCFDGEMLCCCCLCCWWREALPRNKGPRPENGG